MQNLNSMYRLKALTFGLVASLGASLSTAAQAETYRIYLDADFSRMVEASESIELGTQTALSEVDFKVGEHTFELVRKDHRGNPARSKRNMKAFLEDPKALAVMGGLHSPPLLKNKNFINQNQIPTLVPWAAAGPITRASDNDPNYIFRLSVDDSKAGAYLAEYAVNDKGCQTPHLLLEETGWGRNNEGNMTATTQGLLSKAPEVSYFKWGTEINAFRILFRDISQKADCVLFVGNAIEGRHAYEAMASLPKADQRPIISHWGITGGNFWESIDESVRGSLDLSFIQTRFSFTSSPETLFSKGVFDRAQTLNAELTNYESLQAPTGFVHAYDLTRILVQALSSMKFTGDIKQDRATLVKALENQQQPVKGLIRTYKQPFSAYSAKDKDAHEALGTRDFRIGQFKDSGTIYLIAN